MWDDLVQLFRVRKGASAGEVGDGGEVGDVQQLPFNSV